jgi:hypothetical protein
MGYFHRRITLLLLLIVLLGVNQVQYPHRIRAAKNSEVIWENTFGNGGVPQGLIQVEDGGFILTYQADQSWIVYVNEMGVKQWEQNYSAEINALVGTPDGDYAITGRHNNRVWLARCNSTGFILWSKYYSYSAVSNVLLHTNESNFVLAGRIENQSIDVWLQVTLDSGEVYWNNTIGEHRQTRINRYEETDEEVFTLIETVDGGYMMMGRADSYTKAIYLLKTDEFGNKQASNTLAGGYVEGILADGQGGYVFISNINAPSYTINLVQTDDKLSVIHQSPLANQYHRASIITMTQDRHYLIGGFDESIDRLALLKVDKNADLLWKVYIGSNSEGYDYPRYLIETSSDEFVILTRRRSTANNPRDVWLLKVHVYDSMSLTYTEITDNYKILGLIVILSLFTYYGYRRWTKKRLKGESVSVLYPRNDPL